MKIEYAQHQITEADVSAVVDVLRGGGPLARGPVVPRFEAALAELYSVHHAVAFSSGTTALCAAVAASRAKTFYSTTLTFCAVANAVALARRELSLLDIYGATLVSPPPEKPKDDSAFVAMDYGGLVTRIPAHFSNPTIIDASHSLGAGIGRLQPGDMLALSFHPAKHATTGEGGAILTDDYGLFAALANFRDNGRNFGFYAGIGLNGHLDELSAALGLSQLSRLSESLRRRREIAEAYRRAFSSLPAVRCQEESDDHAYHLFAIRVNDRNGFRNRLLERGVGSQVHYYPLHWQPALRHQFRKQSFPVAELAWSRLVSLPMFAGLTDEQVDLVIRAVGDSL